MPPAEVVFYREGETVYFEEWLRSLPVKVQAANLPRCTRHLARKATRCGGRLRIRCATAFTNCVLCTRAFTIRILYFFNGRNVVVISHGLTKEAAVPAVEIRRALERKKKYEADPKAHGWRG